MQIYHQERLYSEYIHCFYGINILWLAPRMCLKYIFSHHNDFCLYIQIHNTLDIMKGIRCFKGEGGSPRKFDHFHWLFVILHPLIFFFWPDGLSYWWCFDKLLYLSLLLCVCSWAGGLQWNGAYSRIPVRILLHAQPPTGLPQRSLQTPPAAQVHFQYNISGLESTRYIS